jgi:nitrite reductase/ring-hydroxylating ferredoxin subunit
LSALGDIAVSKRFWVSVLASECLSPGMMTPVEHGDRRLAIYNIAGEFYATEDIKTQPLFYLTDGWIEGEAVVCPPHQARFDIKTGHSLSSDADNLMTYLTRVVDGNVEVELWSEQ